MNTLTNTVQSIVTDATKVIEKAKATSLSNEPKIIGYVDIEKDEDTKVASNSPEVIQSSAAKYLATLIERLLGFSLSAVHVVCTSIATTS